MGSELEAKLAFTLFSISFWLHIILAADVATSITQQSPNRKLKPASRDSEINTVLNTDSIY